MKAVWKGSASAKKGLAIIATKVFFSLVLSVVVFVSPVYGGAAASLGDAANAASATEPGLEASQLPL
jgi:hypothetical protein